MSDAAIKKVLIVDSDPEVSRKVASWLKGEPIEVIIAADGEAGFMRFKREAPQAVITAAQLPKVVGSVLCQRIKKLPDGKSALVFLASDKYGSHPELGRRAVDMFGADGFLAKPMKREALLEVLDPILSGIGAKTVVLGEEDAPSTTRKSARHTEDLPLPPGKNSDENEKTAILKGNLVGTPLPKLLLHLGDLNRTGKLTIERNRIRREIFFKGGLVAHVTSTLRNENTALMLVEDEIITEEEYSNSLQLMSREGKSLNEAIVASSSLTYESLYAHVQQYERKILTACFAWNEGHFEFHPMDRLPENVPSFDIEPLASIHEGIRRHYPLKRLSSPIHDNMDKYAARTQRFADLIAKLELDTRDLKFTMLIDGKKKVRELITLRREDLTGAYQLLWLLSSSRMIEFDDEPREAAASDFRDSTVESTSKNAPLPKDLLASIMREYYRVKSSNYFKVLGVDYKAGRDEIEAAYENIEQKYHPDNMPDYNLRPILGKLAEILEKAQAARRVLMDERTRREYRHYLEVQERQRTRDEALQAEIIFKEGERALVEQDLPAAIERFEKAVKMRPDEPEYYAYLGWAVFQYARNANNASEVKRAKQHLNKAVAMNPDSDKAYLILGRLYAGEGNLDMAKQYFGKAIEVNPECVPAQKALEILDKSNAGQGT